MYKEEDEKVKQEIIRSARGAGEKKIHNINFPSDGNGWDYKYYKSSRVCQKFSFLFLFFISFASVLEVGARGLRVRSGRILRVTWGKIKFTCFDGAMIPQNGNLIYECEKCFSPPRSSLPPPSSTLEALLNLIHRANMLWFGVEAPPQILLQSSDCSGWWEFVFSLRMQAARCKRSLFLSRHWRSMKMQVNIVSLLSLFTYLAGEMTFIAVHECISQLLHVRHQKHFWEIEMCAVFSSHRTRRAVVSKVAREHPFSATAKIIWIFFLPANKQPGSGEKSRNKFTFRINSYESCTAFSRYVPNPRAAHPPPQPSPPGNKIRWSEKFA